MLGRIPAERLVWPGILSRDGRSLATSAICQRRVDNTHGSPGLARRHSARGGHEAALDGLDGVTAVRLFTLVLGRQ